MCYKMQWHRREKYWAAEMYLIRCAKAFASDDSFKAPPVGETIACIAQRSNLEGSVSLFCEQFSSNCFRTI